MVVATLERPSRVADNDLRCLIAVVIPCYRVTRELRGVIAAIGPDVDVIYCIDDGCPDDSHSVAMELQEFDPRVRPLRHKTNSGVGGAVITGFQQAIADGAEIIVKLDGDGQMDPADIPALIEPIVNGKADYTKGNRFFYLDDLRAMPKLRLFGNAALSFFSKLSSGYWNLFDPTNGFVAIHADVAKLLPLDKLAKRYFFESDMLFRLNTLRAVVVDVPLPARYGDEGSHLSIGRVLLTFPLYHLRSLVKRCFYNYFLRDFNLASINLLFGVGLMLFGLIFGATQWIEGIASHTPASSGTVMIAALPIILGFQLLLSAVNYDIAGVPREPIHRRLRERRATAESKISRRAR